MGYIDIGQKREAAREYYRRKYQESARFRVKEADRKAEWFNFDADKERLEELKRERDRKRRARLARQRREKKRSVRRNRPKGNK